MSEENKATGVLLNGRRWKLVESGKSAVIKGRHLILLFEDESTGSEKEMMEMMTVAMQLAWENVIENGRYRIAVNGPNVAKAKHFHIHLIIPAGEDKLPRLVDKM